MTAAAIAAPLWAIATVSVLPVLAGGAPAWTAKGMQALLPDLVGWVLFGAVFGLLSQAFTDLAVRFFGPEKTAPHVPSTKVTRVVILGGGFAGVTTAEHLEQEFGADPNVQFTIISEANALLFTPMLAEVAASSLEPTHITTPIRSGLRRTRVMRRRIIGIDVAQKTVSLESDDRSASAGQTSVGIPDIVPYDHLVLALGSISNYLGLHSVEEHAFDFKSILDAIRIRNQVIEQFERADQEVDSSVRSRMVTFVVAGGGFAGVELAGGLNDFARGMTAYFPNVQPEDVRVILVHSRDRILPELSEALGAYALEKMSARGVIFKLGKRVSGARKDAVILGDEEIPAETLIWTAGVRPSPLLDFLPYERDQRGALKVANTMQAPNADGIWAVGDCAAVVDAKTGQPCPPTAQYALREAYTLAHNIHAAFHNKPLKPFHFDAIGMLAVVGHHTACAEVKGIRFSGLLAWLMWRGIYLSKLPGLERKVRVLSDWLIELVFPRDIAQTIDVRELEAAAVRRSSAGAASREARR